MRHHHKQSRWGTLLLVSLVLLLPVAVRAAGGGTVVAWGDNSQGESTVPAGLTGVTSVAAGHFHSLALLSNGTVQAWGEDNAGQIDVPAGLSGVAAIAAGDLFSLALLNTGQVVAWGYNGFGQTNVPAGLSGVTAIAAGTDHSLALLSNGTVVGWGQNTLGAATPPAGLTGVVAISAGQTWSMALKNDGTVVTWGEDNVGQTDVPAGLTGVAAISAGSVHGLALLSTGTVVGWGSNLQGELNPPAGLTGVIAISAGSQWSMALKSDGTVVGWGLNSHGQTTGPAGLSGVTAISAGTFHALAVEGSNVLIASPGIVPEGAPLTATWTSVPSPAAKDWVGLYPVGAGLFGYLAYTNTNGTINGSWTVQAPFPAGNYEFRYYRIDNTLITVSNPVTVTGTVASGSLYSLTPSTTALTSGQSLSATWAAPAPRPTTDWVGLFPVGAAANGYVAWVSTKGQSSGTMSTTAPVTPGAYEFRYYDHTNRLAATSASITVTQGAYSVTSNVTSGKRGGYLTASWTAPAGTSRTDWVGLVSAAQISGSSITNDYAYAYTNGAISGNAYLTFPSNAPSGTYYVVYLTNNTNNIAAQSGPITLP